MNKQPPVVRVGMLRPTFWSREAVADLLRRERLRTGWRRSSAGGQRTYRAPDGHWANPYTVTTFAQVRP